MEYIFSIVDSILASMVETFQQYLSINEPFQRQPESFTQLKNGLRNIAKNLVKEELPQGKLILSFVDSISKNLELLKEHTSELAGLRRLSASGNIYIDNGYADFMKEVSAAAISYKRNIKELIRKFAKMRA